MRTVGRQGGEPSAEQPEFHAALAVDADQGDRLRCEELKAPAATCQLTFPVTPTKPAAKRAARRQPATE
ncbi:hypothetical protein ACWDBW_34760 [Streptomyces sp. NPDC001107]